MSDEKWLFLSPKGLSFAISPHRNVGIRLDYPQEETGLLPGVVLAIELTPTEARNIAETLVRKAAEAEAGLARC